VPENNLLRLPNEQPTESATITTYQSHATAEAAVNHVRLHGAAYDSNTQGQPCFRITITATKINEGEP
jgi:hypothetical protein